MAKIRKGISPHQNHGLQQPYIFLKNAFSVVSGIICFFSWCKSDNVRVTGIPTVRDFKQCRMNIQWGFMAGIQNIALILIYFLVWLFSSFLCSMTSIAIYKYMLWKSILIFFVLVQFFPHRPDITQMCMCIHMCVYKYIYVYIKRINDTCFLQMLCHVCSGIDCCPVSRKQ